MVVIYDTLKICNEICIYDIHQVMYMLKYGFECKLKSEPCNMINLKFHPIRFALAVKLHLNWATWTNCVISDCLPCSFIDTIDHISVYVLFEHLRLSAKLIRYMVKF